MTVRLHATFTKSYQKRVKPFPKLVKQFQQRLELFISNPKHLQLKDHALQGEKKTFRAFSITGDIRVVYYIHDNIAFLIDIGSHNQVY